MSTKTFKNWEQFAVFPCRYNSKLPATANGFKDAVAGQDVLSLINQGYNVGLACSLSNLIVIDCDEDESKGYHGINDLQNLESEICNLPKTLTQKTPRGGRHYIFSAKGITNPRGKLGKSIDVKMNGYIMIAPSAINGNLYQIIDGIDENGNFIIAELPVAWRKYINKDSIESENRFANRQNINNNKLFTNIDVEKMFNNCAFLRYCKDNADCLSEPEWFTMISILAQIKDSDELIHTLSDPYPTYSFEETQKKIDYARKFGYSQTCKYISTEFPEICKSCTTAHNVKDEVNYDN